MGERKVLNRYFPPDFDPLLVPRRKWDPYKQARVPRRSRPRARSIAPRDECPP